MTSRSPSMSPPPNAASRPFDDGARSTVRYLSRSIACLDREPAILTGPSPEGIEIAIFAAEVDGISGDNRRRHDPSRLEPPLLPARASVQRIQVPALAELARLIVAEIDQRARQSWRGEHILLGHKPPFLLARSDVHSLKEMSIRAAC